MINFSKTKFTSKSASNINYINDSENIYTRFTKIAPSNISGLFFTLITGAIISVKEGMTCTEEEIMEYLDFLFAFAY